MFDQLTPVEWDALTGTLHRGIVRATRLAVFVAPSKELWDLVHDMYAEAMEIQQELIADGPGGSWRAA